MRLYLTTAALLSALSVAGCGGAGRLPEVAGSYDGTSEVYNATNFGMRTFYEEQVITVAPIPDDDARVFVGIDSHCALEASVDDLSITVMEQTCEWETATTSESWTYAGGGSVTENGSLMLALGGSYTRTYKDNSPPLEGNHRLTFEGERL